MQVKGGGKAWWQAGREGCGGGMKGRQEVSGHKVVGATKGGNECSSKVEVMCVYKGGCGKAGRQVRERHGRQKYRQECVAGMCRKVWWQ